MKYRVLLLAALSAGCFSTDFASGTVHCSNDPSRPCPSGYFCANDLCWRNGDTPTGEMDMAVSAMPDLTGGPMKHKGDACAVNGECDTGFCVDNVCCTTDCASTCSTCSLAGSLGTCMPVPAAQLPPHGSCNKVDATLCGNDGKCDGKGNCRLYPSGTACSTANCNTGTNIFQPSSLCDGNGKCIAQNSYDCAPYKCNGTAACFANCTDNTSCSGSNQCTNMSCGTLANGRPCTSGSQCTSTHCVDLVCCDMACSGQCQACDVVTSVGTCAAVAGGVHTSNGLRQACSGSGVCAGTCDGTNVASCNYPGPTMMCSPQTCSGTPPTLTMPAFCNSSHVCPSGTMSACQAPANGSPICTGTACDFTCSSPFSKQSAYCVANFTAETASTDVDLRGVWGSGSTNVFAVGDTTAGSTHRAIVHTTGNGTWSAVSPGLPSSGVQAAAAIWGSSPADIYVVGFDDASHATDGQTFTQESGFYSTIFDGYFAIFGVDQYNAWAVGRNTGGGSLQGVRIRRLSGAPPWIDETSGVGGQTTGTSIWASSTSDVYITLDTGQIIHATGMNKWGMPAQTTNVTTALRGIWGSSSSDVYAVGDSGVILHSSGNGSWTKQASGSTKNLMGVWGSSSSDVYVVGQGGTVLHSGGNGVWVPQISNVTTDLNAIWGSGPVNIFAVGNGATIIHLH